MLKIAKILAAQVSAQLFKNNCGASAIISEIIALQVPTSANRPVIAPTSFIFNICFCSASNPHFHFLFLQQPKKVFACSSLALYFASFCTALDNCFFTLFARLLFTLALNHMLFSFLLLVVWAVRCILTRKDFAVFLFYFYFWKTCG